MRCIQFLSILILSSCTSAPPQWTPREPASVISSTEDEAPSLQEGLTAADYRLLISTSLKSLEKKCHAPKYEPHMISSFQNQTSTDLGDMSMMRRELIDILHSNGVTLVDRDSRVDLSAEATYENESGMTDPEQAIVRGKQSGVRHLIRVVINARTETGANNRFTRYRLSLQFVNSESSEVECVGVGELKKHYTRDRSGW